MIFFTQIHSLRMIRSIFPLSEESKEKVIGFKLAKKTDECSGITIYMARIASTETTFEQTYILYMLLESDMPRYTKVFN